MNAFVYVVLVSILYLMQTGASAQQSVALEKWKSRSFPIETISGVAPDSIYSIPAGTPQEWSIVSPPSVVEYMSSSPGMGRIDRVFGPSNKIPITPSLTEQLRGGIMKYHRVQDPTEVPVVTKGTNNSVTLNQLPGCGAVSPATKNAEAQRFIEKHSLVSYSVAAVVGIPRHGGAPELQGTAFLISSPTAPPSDTMILASAGHVYFALSTATGNKRRIVGNERYSAFYAVFDAFGGKLPPGLQGYNPKGDTSAVEIPLGQQVHVDLLNDLGLLAVRSKRATLRLAASDPGRNDPVALLGFPDRAESVEGPERENEIAAYGICGRTVPSGEQFPRELRLSTGIVAGFEARSDKKGWLKVTANSEVGNSGSPLFSMETGEVVGILVNGENVGGAGFNHAVPVSRLQTFLTSSWETLGPAATVGPTPVALRESTGIGYGHLSSN